MQSGYSCFLSLQPWSPHWSNRSGPIWERRSHFFCTRLQARVPRLDKVICSKMLYMPLKVVLFHHHQEISLWHCFQVILKEACMDSHSSTRIPSLQCWTCSKDRPCSDSWKRWFFWDYALFSRWIIPLSGISAKKVKYPIINNVLSFFRTILDWFYSRKWLWVYAEVSLQCSAWWVLWVCAFLIHAFWNKVLP